MAYEFYVTIEAASRAGSPGRARASAQGQARRDRLQLRGHVPARRRERPGEPQARARRRHVHEGVGRRVAAAVQALVTSEVITSALFEFVRTNDVGVEHVFHTIKLTNAP